MWELVNVGLAPATNVLLDVTISEYLEPLSWTAPGGGICNQGATATNWNCSIPTVPQNTAQQLRLQARASSEFLPPSGSYLHADARAQASSTAEAILGQLVSSASIRIASTIADLALEMDAPETPVQGSRVAVVLTGSNGGPDKATNLALKLWTGGPVTGPAMAIESIESTAATCTVNADGDVECQIEELPSGGTFTVTVAGLAQAERFGGYLLQAYLESDVFDPIQGNDQAFGSVYPMAPPPSTDPVTPPASPPPASQGGGGGGGAIELASLVYLLALLVAQRARSNRITRSPRRTKR